MLKLNKFKKNITIQLKGLCKEVYKSSYEEGQGDYVQTQGIDYLTKTFMIEENNIDNFENMLVSYLQKELYHEKINNEWLSICDNRITLTTSEIDTEYSCEIVDDIQQEELQGNQCYMCDYDFYILINDMKLSEEELIELLPSICS